MDKNLKNLHADKNMYLIKFRRWRNLSKMSEISPKVQFERILNNFEIILNTNRVYRKFFNIILKENSLNLWGDAVKNTRI